MLLVAQELVEALLALTAAAHPVALGLSKLIEMMWR